MSLHRSPNDRNPNDFGSPHLSIGQLGRRAWLLQSSLLMANTCVAAISNRGICASAATIVKFGLITDMHYADKPTAGSRHYRETLDKLAETGLEFAKHKLNFVAELGDFIDAADSVAVELGFLKRIQTEFRNLAKDRHYVLGNHCVDTLTKREFLDEVEQGQAFYAYDRGGLHFIVLDACFNAAGQSYGRKNFTWTDTNIPDDELQWLETDLARTSHKVIVFVHQRLDHTKNHSVKNCSAVRTVLEKSGKVLAVFQGHSHQNDYQEINGIHYCTLVAMVEGSGATNSGYAIVKVHDNHSIRVSGFRKQLSRQWPHSARPG